MRRIYSMGLIISLVASVGCKGLPPFPSKGIYEVPAPVSCVFYPIIKENPLTYGDGVDKPCPIAVFGFDENETPKVMDYIRYLQEEAGKIDKWQKEE